MDSSSLLAQRITDLNLSFAAVSRRIERATGGTLRPDPSLVWRWTRGRTRPSGVYLSALAGALDLDEEQLREDIEEQWKNRAKSAASELSASKIRNNFFRLREIREMVNRRSLLKAGATIFAFSTVEAVAPVSSEAVRLAEVTGRSEISDGSIEAINVLTDHFAQNFVYYDLEEIVRQLNPYVTKVADALGGPLRVKQRGELCLRGAQLSALLGRTARSLGRLGDARLHFTNAFSLAEEIDHHDLMSWVVLEEATMASQAGAPEAALKLATAALPYSKAGSAVQALSLVARTEALLGKQNEASRAIVQTERTIGKIRPDEDSDKQNIVFNGWGASSTLHAVGRAWLWLGQPREAELCGAAAAAEASKSTSMWRNQNSAQGELVVAGARAQLGEPAEAARIIQRILSERQHAAYILITQTSDVLSHLEPYGNLDEVQALMAALSQFRELESRPLE